MSVLATLLVAAVYVVALIMALKCLPVVAKAWVTTKAAAVTNVLPFCSLSSCGIALVLIDMCCFTRVVFLF